MLSDFDMSEAFPDETTDIKMNGADEVVQNKIDITESVQKASMSIDIK